MGQGRDASAFFDAPDPFVKRRFVALNAGLRLVGEIDVERLLKILSVGPPKISAIKIYAFHCLTGGATWTSEVKSKGLEQSFTWEIPQQVSPIRLRAIETPFHRVSRS